MRLLQLRRERIADKMKALLELVPNANKEDQIFPCLFFLLSFSPFAHSFERSSRKLSLRCGEGALISFSFFIFALCCDVALRFSLNLVFG